MENSLSALLADAAASGVAPRLDAAVWIDGDLREASSHQGERGVFDLASLTKPLASGLVALSLAADGSLDLDAPDPQGIAIRRLLDHSAGFESWRPLFVRCLEDRIAGSVFAGASGSDARLGFRRGRELMAEVVAAEMPTAPAGAQTRYSDLGFLRLQRRLEAAAGEPLDLAFHRRVADPLNLGLRFVDLAAGQSLPEALPTGFFRPRPPAPGQEATAAGLPSTAVGPRPGEVEDDNAFAMGGVAGHAGLFGTARAVAMAGACFLQECEGRGRLAPANLAREFCGPSGPEGRGLGWDRPSGSWSLGTVLGRGPRGAVGHLGFTGTSLWVDLDRRVAIALCTNRVFHGRENLMIHDFRPRFHDAVARSLELV